ncbi:hypothetical protein HPB49_001614 [Dermacentor silvarum]|uniref:Uncharacterized protein n=1 Tax=Dermacentor silvarum TaxID=543639 RepID=A0ACB8D217_DERSI|nr:hypothetical protein HPB49_001614 [Dermacentor silvarum]
MRMDRASLSTISSSSATDEQMMRCGGGFGGSIGASGGSYGGINGMGGGFAGGRIQPGQLEGVFESRTPFPEGISGGSLGDSGTSGLTGEGSLAAAPEFRGRVDGLGGGLSAGVSHGAFGGMTGGLGVSGGGNSALRGGMSGGAGGTGGLAGGMNAGQLPGLSGGRAEDDEGSSEESKERPLTLGERLAQRREERRRRRLQRRLERQQRRRESRHFGSSDFKEGCKICKLKKDAVPSIFEGYPAYLQPPKNRERSDASARKREAAAPVNTPPPKRRALESQQESPSLPLNDLPSVDVASQELSLMDCSATKLPLPLKNCASERCITTTVQVDRAVQVSSLFSVSAMDRRKWRRKERDLNAPIERLKNTVDKYKQELQKLKEECYVSAFLQVVEKAKEKDLAASILVEQVQNFAKKKPTWSEVTVRQAVVLRNLSTRAYEHLRSSSRGEVGMTELVRQRLPAELASHPSLHARARSLIVDEMRVKQRLLYHKQRDAFIGEVYYGVNFPKETTNEPVLANSLLCFVLNGLSVSFKIPVAYFFARNCTGRELHMLMSHVLKEVEEIGFFVVRIVTDNHKINVLAMQLLCNGSLKHCIDHPGKPNRKLFLAFDQCHLIKNVRLQFLSRDIGKGGAISANHLKSLYRMQQGSLLKPVRFLTRQHVFPTNMEK